MYLGRIDRKKNIDLIIKSISKAKLSNFNLNIVGSGDKKYLKYLNNLSCELQLNDNINFIEHLDRESKIYFYKILHIFYYHQNLKILQMLFLRQYFLENQY